MKKQIFRIAGYILLLVLCILLALVFYPRNYKVPQLKYRTGTKYWKLATASNIGYFLVQAKGEKKPYPIIILQGGPGGSLSDRSIRILSPLSELGYDIYFYDQAGSGHSERLADISEYSVDRHIKDLAEIVKQIGTEKVILIGQSWGAILATEFTANYPLRVDKLILTSPGPILPVKRELVKVKPPDSLQLKPPILSNLQAVERTNSLRNRAVFYWAILFGRKLASDKEADDFQTYLNSELNKSTVSDTAKALKDEGGGGYYAQVMTVRSFADVKDPRPVLRNLNIPVLVMKGQFDNQKWGFTNEYLQLFRNSKLVFVPNAGHSISVEQPDVFIYSIRSFLME